MLVIASAHKADEDHATATKLDVGVLQDVVDMKYTGVVSVVFAGSIERWMRAVAREGVA